MKCPDPPAHPAASSGLRAPLLAVAGLAVLSLGVYVASLLGGVLVAAVVVVYAAAITGAVVWVRKYAWPRHKRVVNPVTLPTRVGVKARGSNPLALPVGAPLALPAARPAVQGVVVSDGERIGAWQK